MSRITETGVFQMSDLAYQSDPCEEVSLRSSVAWKLIDKGGTPAAAAYATPRLNPNYVREEKRHFDLGKACHATLFGKGAAIALIDGYDYQTNEPRNGLKRDDKKALRDAAYEAGQIPLLIPEMKQVNEMAAAAKRQIAALIEAGTIDSNPFDNAQSEQVLVWRDRAVLCRAALDGLSVDGDTLSEYKTDGQSAAPENFMWKARRLGYVFRLAFYRRGMEALKVAYSPRIHLFVQESFPPYLLAFYRIEDELVARENERVIQALKIWRRCLETDHWPGFSTAGFDLGLTDKEEIAAMQGPSGQKRGDHVDSETIASSL